MTSSIEVVDIDMKEMETLLERARAGSLSEQDYDKLKAAIETLAYLTGLVKDKETTIEQLRQLLFARSSEKTRQVLKGAGATRGRKGSQKRKNKGHGRNGAEAYKGAEKIKVGHESINSGDRCPECMKGKIYGMKNPGVLIRIVGQAPIQARVYELEKLRCNLCGEVWTAKAPEGVGSEKYDETSASMIALLKYGSGLPFYRLEGLQESLGIPLPASTQWEIVAEAASVIAPAHEELIRQAAQGDLLYNDDTSMKVLELNGAEVAQDSSERTGVFTSGIVATQQGWKIALFFTGRKHAGENMADVLAQRAVERGPPIQMCDALSRNLPKELEVIVANCMAHGRRHFVDVAQNFPDECRHVLETLGEVYKNDADAREQGLSPEERLSFHKARSGPLMEELQQWLRAQFDDRKVEPNSGLGKAIRYMLNHWDRLTLFLQKPGAPLDNNVCERALKKAILHRKNSLFFKTENGAHVGDVFMSLIHTCQLCDADPFDYLTELQRHSLEISENPQEWMPWNYRTTLDQASASGEAPR